MGFSSTDLWEDLSSYGPIGLLYIFFLSFTFPKFLQEMLGVCRYFAYDVFKVCKYFIVDSVQMVKKKVLNNFFIEENSAIDVVLFFCTGMLVDWFSLMTKNKDFDKSYSKVIRKAKKTPKMYLKLAEKKYADAQIVN